MRKIPIHIDKLYKYDLCEEVCQVAIPFGQGVLASSDLDVLCIEDSDGAEMTSMIKQTATWPDGSIKYLFVRFLANLPANKNALFYLSKSVGLPKEGRILIASEDEKINVDNGSIKFTLVPGNSVFETFTHGNRVYENSQFVGPQLKLNGVVSDICIQNWKIVEKGNVCAIFEGDGKYLDKYRVITRVTVYPGKEYIDISFRLFNDSEEELVPDSWIFYVKRTMSSDVNDSLVISSKGNQDSTGCGDANDSGWNEDSLTFETTGTGMLSEIENLICDKSKSHIRTLTGVSNYKTRFDISGEGNPVNQVITAKMLVGEANEHYAEVLYGTFMADFCDEDGGVCGTVFQAHQNFPKAIKASKDGLCIYLIPEGEEKVSFASGMAREQRLQLHFHSACESIEMLDNRSLIYQMPVMPWVLPDEFMSAKVFPNVVTSPDKANADVELSMISKADAHGRAYGMMNWGDFPDSNYTQQGRGGGRLVWTNNEYDYPHAQFMMYARTGERRFLDYAKVAARHWMDVDICHYSEDPLRIGGQWEHTACHNGGNFAKTGVKGVMVCSHEWVEGMIDLWHFTGDDRAYETAIGIGENVLRLLDTPMYQKPGEANARETGWALRTLTALYIETHDKKWIDKCEWIVSQFAAWKEKYGAWLAPYTDNTVIRVGFMISVAVGSLMRYYREFPSDSLREMILSAVDDLLETELNPYGLFYYKDLPSLRRNGKNTLLLESMYIGYELTGDTKYLQAGLKTFWVNMDDAVIYNSGKKIVEDAVLVGTTSPKGFGQSFLPLVQFYNAALDEGMI